MAFSSSMNDTRRDAVGERDRGFERFGEPLLCVVAHAQPVDDRFDRVLLVLVERRRMIEVGDDAVDARPDESVGDEFAEHVLVFAFAIGDHRREHHDARIARQREHLVDHLTDGLRRERLTVVRAARLADAREQQAQVVVDFGDRADGRARVVRRRFLFDRDRRRQPFDVVDVGLFHHRQELPRVRRQRFDVATLAFRVQRIERERRLARPGQDR